MCRESHLLSDLADCHFSCNLVFVGLNKAAQRQADLAIGRSAVRLVRQSEVKHGRFATFKS